MRGRRRSSRNRRLLTVGAATVAAGAAVNLLRRYRRNRNRRLSPIRPSDWVQNLLCRFFPARYCGHSVVVVGSTQKVRPTEKLRGTREAKLLAARNEFESFQIVIQAGSVGLRNVTVSLSTQLNGPVTIPVNNVTIYREEYYDVVVPSDSEGAAGRWPDALIPTVDPWYNESRNAFPINIPAGENRVAWVDVLIPQTAPPGSYSGVIKVAAQNATFTVPIQLTVFNATLPSTASLKSAFGMSWNDVCNAVYGSDCWKAPATEADGWRLNALCARAALDNRITICYPHYQPLKTSNLPLFRQHVLPLINGTAPTRLPGAKLTSYQVDNKAPYLAEWRNEAQNQLFADRAFVYACDEPGTNAAEWNDCHQEANDAKAVWSNVPILVTATIQDASAFNASNYVNFLVPLVNHIEDKSGRYAGNQRSNYDMFLSQNPKNEVWLYTSCMSHGCEPNDTIRTNCQSNPMGSATSDPYFDGWPSYVIDAPASEARAMGWLSFLYRTTGELHFATMHCLKDAWTTQYAYGGNGDGTLFYPGSQAKIGGTNWIPIESMRLKLIRDGYEDYEYLKILVDRNQAPAAFDVAKQLFPSAFSTNRSDIDVQVARRKLAHLIDPVNVP